MKDGLRHIATVAVCLTIAYVCATLRDCGGDPADVAPVVLPAPDSGFAAVVARQYQPPILPAKKPGPAGRLPKGTAERDVRRVITVNAGDLQETRIIVLKDGTILVPKSEQSLQVMVTDYLPPFIALDVTFGAGVTLDADARLSPSLSVSLLRINGRIHAPVVAADLRSIGIGAGYQVSEQVVLTPLLMWHYTNTHRTIKLQASVTL